MGDIECKQLFIFGLGLADKLIYLNISSWFPICGTRPLRKAQDLHGVCIGVSKVLFWQIEQKCLNDIKKKIKNYLYL